MMKSWSKIFVFLVGSSLGFILAALLFWQWHGRNAPTVIVPVAGVSFIESSAENGKIGSPASTKEMNDTLGEIVIHLAGAVQSPGLLKISPDMRLGEALQKAGGALEEADLNHLNLAIRLEDGARYYIPTIEEGKLGAATSLIPEEDGKLDLNQASLSDLIALPQIGEGRAKAILEYREKQGRFHSIEDIKKVPGIGEGIFAVIRDQITVR